MKNSGSYRIKQLKKARMDVLLQTKISPNFAYKNIQKIKSWEQKKRAQEGNQL